MRPLLLLSLLAAVSAHAQDADGGIAATDGEMTLAQAYKLASERNEALRLSDQNVRQAEVSRLSALAVAAPNARIDVVPRLASPGVLGANLATSNTGQVQATAVLTQPVLRVGFFSATEAAAAAIAGADALLVRSEEQLYLDVATVFISVLRARQQLKVAEAATERALAEEKSVAARVQAGGALRSSQLQSVINRRRGQFSLLTATQAVQEQEVLFQRIVRAPPPPSLVLPPVPKLPALEGALELSRERADVRAAEENIRAAQLTETALSGRFWPRVDAAFAFNALAPANFNPVAYSAQLVMSIPLFEADSYVQVRAQRVRTRVAELTLSQLQNQVAEQVRRAAVQLQIAERALELAREQQLDAQENYNLVTNQFKLRAVSFIEVIQAQASLTEAESLIAGAKYDRETAGYQLLFASGQLATMAARK